MELKKAIEITEHYQLWRLGKIDEIDYCPKELTEAIDVLLEISNTKVRKDKLNEVLRRESEETKDLEIEEAAENYGWRIKKNCFSDPVKANDLANSAKEDFIKGAKWLEQRRFTDDDMRDAYSMGMFAVTSGRNFKDWFSKYKKK